MDNVYVGKEKFCKNELLVLVQAIYPKIIRLDYQRHNNGEETVTIVWTTSSGEAFRSVNVTGDSLAALARDVLKYI